jgi:hypothetical protein
MFYIFYLAAAKKDNLYSPDAEKYLASFKPIPIPVTQWAPYEFPEEGFKVLLPGKPKIDPLKTARIAARSIHIPISTQTAESIISSRREKTKAYSDYWSNSAFFENYLEHVRSGVVNREPTITDTIVNGFSGEKIYKAIGNECLERICAQKRSYQFFCSN